VFFFRLRYCGVANNIVFSSCFSGRCKDLFTYGSTHMIFGLFPSSGILENTTFRKLDLCPSSGEGGGEDTCSVWPLIHHRQNRLESTHTIFIICQCLLRKVVLKISNVTMLCYSLCLSCSLHNGVANNVVLRLIFFVYNLVHVFRLHVPLRSIGMRCFCFSCFRFFLWIDLIVGSVVSGRVVL
jgi:hypothetical protein